MKNLRDIVNLYHQKPSRSSIGLSKYVIPVNIVKAAFISLFAYLLGACSDTHNGINSKGVEYSGFPKGWIPEEIERDDTTKVSYIEMPTDFEPYHNSPRLTSEGNQINEGYFYITEKGHAKTDGFQDWVTVTLIPDTAYANAQLEKGKLPTTQGPKELAKPFDKK